VRNITFPNPGELIIVLYLDGGIQRKCKAFYLKYPHLKWVSFRDMKGLPREVFAKSLAESCLAIWVDKSSSFGTFPVEAMKSDVPVLGLVPDMIPEWMGDKNGLWTHDPLVIVDLVANYFQAWLEDNEPQELYDEMSKIKEQYTLEQQKNKVDEVYNKMSRESVVQGIKQKIHGYDTGYGEAGIKDSFTPDLVKRPFLIPRAAGSISKKLEKVSSSSLSQKLYKAPDHMVEKIADYIKDTSPTYSKALKDAIVNKDSYKKNAAIFALMQNPNFKNMIPAFFEQEESEEMPNE
jgi:hypothetical protein